MEEILLQLQYTQEEEEEKNWDLRYTYYGWTKAHLA